LTHTIRRALQAWSCYLLLFTHLVNFAQSRLSERHTYARWPLAMQTPGGCVHKLYPKESGCVPAERTYVVGLNL